MRELIMTNDLVLISYVEALLAEQGIEAVVFDRNISLMEGSIGAFPRRVVVAEDLWLRARAVLDVGAGVGTVGLCVAARCPAVKVVLLERDPNLVALAHGNIERNELANRASVIETDITRATAALEKAGTASETFAIVLANPPYHDDGRSTVSESRLKAVSHQMPEDGLEGWARFMCRMAAPGGRVAMIHKAEALPRILAAFEGRFGSVGVLPIYARAGEPAIRVIVEGIKSSRAPPHIKPGLVLHGSENDFLPEIEAVFRRGAALPAQCRG
jgi:FkbM family methyltransferase